jgi:hypothetical protein
MSVSSLSNGRPRLSRMLLSSTMIFDIISTVEDAIHDKFIVFLGSKLQLGRRSHDDSRRQKGGCRAAVRSGLEDSLATGRAS